MSPQAKSQEIKKAYLKLAQTYHPDKNQGNKLAEKKFQQINSAYQILKDPTKRKKFNEQLALFQKNRREKLMPFPVPAQPAPVKEKPVDLEITLKISLEDLCRPRSKIIHYLKLVNGQKLKSFLKVQPPLGARSGQRLRFKGKGGGEGKKQLGDLYVRIQVRPHKIFHIVKGSADLIVEMPIPFVLAFQGGSIKIPSPYGFLNVNLKPPVRHQQLLKIEGYGLPKNLKGDKGDLFTKIFIDYPKKDGLKIQRQMESLPFAQQKIYVAKFKDSPFIYPKVLKFQKIVQELNKKHGYK